MIRKTTAAALVLSAVPTVLALSLFSGTAQADDDTPWGKGLDGDTPWSKVIDGDDTPWPRGHRTSDDDTPWSKLPRPTDIDTPWDDDTPWS